MTRRLILILLLGLILLIWFSIALASFIYLKQMGYADYFEFPYLQYLTVTPAVFQNGVHDIDSFKAMTSMLLAGLTPIAFLFLAVVAFVRFYVVKIRKKRNPSLYGETGFADPGNSARNKILTREIPYR